MTFHSAPTTRAFTPGRIVALALIGLVVLGLGYLRFAPGDSVSVPKGARAGQLTLHDCTYATEKGTYAADCGTLVVPENRARPGSRLIAIPVTRIKSRSANPGEPVFRLQGGPGATNMDFPDASRFAEHRDVVLVGYRGVDGSSRLDCPEVESAISHAKDLLGEKFFTAYADGFRDCAARLTGDGVDIAGYGITAQVDDLEAARKALGYEQIDLVSESAGTRAAMIYAWRHPKAIHRSVMIGVNPPGNFVWSGKATDEQLRKYAAYCKQDDSCSRRADDLVATLKRTNDDIPGSYFGLPINEGNVRVASFYGLMESTSDAAPLNAPMTLGSWLSAADGDASGFWFQSVMAQLAFPQSFVWGQMAAFGRVDAAAAKDYFAHHRGDGEIIGNPGGEFLWGGGKLADAWPALPNENEYSRVRRSDVETLLVGGELDFATPPQIATKELLPYLPNGHEVVLKGFGHSTSFWTQQADAGTHLINTYLDSGRVDPSQYEPQKVDFTPELTQTALGKGIAGGIAGLAALMVLSLLWMGGRAHLRGRYGRKSSATLRSAYPIVLGLGGWFAGLLIVFTTMPGTPLNSAALAVLGMGAPIGLGLYFAWVDRRWSLGTKAAGLAAAFGGALAGAWLGFNVAEDMLALITTIAGAAAAGNLALLVLDIVWDARGRSRVAERAEQAPAARPVVG